MTLENDDQRHDALQQLCLLRALDPAEPQAAIFAVAFALHRIWGALDWASDGIREIAEVIRNAEQE